MDSKIFKCVDNNDVKGLKLLRNYPNFFQIEDYHGHTILQRAIRKSKIAVFNFLLSLDGCPINARNSRGRTALEVVYHFHSGRRRAEYFVYYLLKKGAGDSGDINCCDRKTSLLHDAIVYNHIKVAKFLIEKGADLNCYYNNVTALHRVLLLRGNRNEMLAMFLYFGADPSIPDAEGYKPIDFAFKDGRLSESIREHLIFNFFDDYCTDYEIPLDSLFDLLESESALAPQVIKYISSVKVDEERISINDLETFFIKLFTIKLDYLKLLLEKFDYVIEAILDDALDRNFIPWRIAEEMFVTQNLDLLLQSQFNSNIIQVINDKIHIYTLFDEPEYFTESRIHLFNLILLVLSYGGANNIYDFELELIYKIFGDCEFFRTLLHMDIKITIFRDRNLGDVIPGLFYDIHMDIETFLCDPHNYSLDSMKELLNYFVHPKLKSFFSSLPIQTQNGNILAKVKDLPTVPLLVELARNKVRKFLIQKYKIENSMQFYTLIKHLPISKIHEKIITLETKLY